MMNISALTTPELLRYITALPTPMTKLEHELYTRLNSFDSGILGVLEEYELSTQDAIILEKQLHRILPD